MIRRLEEPCRQCGSAVYTRTDDPARGKCSHCGLDVSVLHYVDGTKVRPWPGEGPAKLVTPTDPAGPPPRMTAREKWKMLGLQLALTFWSIAAILILAKLGLALPPPLMLAVGFACIVLGSIAGVWIVAGELVAEWAKRRRP